MRVPSRSWMIGCSIALATTTTVILVRLFVSEMLDQRIPLYLSLVVAVFAAAALGGIRAGLPATALCIGLATWIMPNVPELNAESTILGRIVVFLVEGIAISVCFEAMHVARRRMYEKKAQLEQEVAERREMARKLVEAARNKNHFLATLAHELRNPLAPIRNCLELMRRAPADQDQMEDARAMIERQVDQMVRLVNDLLDISRISRNKIELHKEQTALAEIMDRALETSRPQIEAAGHTLTINMPSEPIFVSADTVRLIQVFSNLLNNAAKYTPRGGQIRLAARCLGNEVEISVHDNGVGIPPDMLSRVFEMFTQVEHNRARAQGGLGVGLSLVKKLVEMHGGSVECHSEGHDKGSAFVVRLPLCPAEPLPAPAPEPGVFMGALQSQL